MHPEWATLEEIGDKYVLRFERKLAHPPEKVFRAISEPDELRHWFPATMETELRPGAPIRFAFEEDDAPGGEVLEIEAPKLFVYTWGDDVLRWEIVPEGDGCRLFFSQTIAPDGISGGRPGTARNAAGWHVCLSGLAARLHEPAPDADWFPLFEAYVERFGLGAATVRDGSARFERDVVQTPEQVWALLCDGVDPAVGADAPRRFGPAPPGRASAVERERELAYDGVRWTLEPRMPGSLVVVELADPRPETLAAWQVHLELLVAGLHGIERCWPDERVTALTARYFSAAGQAIR